jgi:hypothetical protein
LYAIALQRIISMNTISHKILILFALNFLAVLIASVVWKNKNVSFYKLIMAGSNIYRDLSKYIQPAKEKNTI